MNIGIIIHSHTGHTLSVAEKLQDELLKTGHSARIERVSAINEDPSSAKNIQLKTAPDIKDYDRLIIGAPVRGFSLSSVMEEYLSQLTSLKDKKIDCFVTQAFPYPWMGGNRSINQMKDICEAKDGKVYKKGIINWSHKNRDKKIADLVENFKKSE